MKKLMIYLFCCFIIIFCCSLQIKEIKATDNQFLYELPEDIHLDYVNDALDESLSYNSNLTEYDSFLVSYFDNLLFNFGMNYKGSCGYVGIGMLLSYYDSFLLDSIVPEQYDVISRGSSNNIITRRNSPGILHDVLEDPNDPTNTNYVRNLTATQYYIRMSSLSTSSLHAKLLMIGAGKGYYNMENNVLPASLYFDNVIEITETYLKDVVNLSESDFAINYTNSNVRQFVINNIKNENPVLLGIKRGSIGGHIVIAYDYDDASDTIYCHFGWGPHLTHVTIESQDFDSYVEAMTLDLNFDHSHSNNYAITRSNNDEIVTTYYCSRDCNLQIFNHSHFYDIHTCMYCGHCGFSTVNHTYNDNYEWIDYSTHKSICECGEYVSQPHAVLDSSPQLGGYKICIFCNGQAQIGFDFGGILSTRNKMTTVNGSYVNNYGVIILSDEDLNEYLNGTLHFFNNENINLN